MNTNAITHTDFIFSITADWVLLPIIVIAAVVIGFAACKKFKK